MYNKEACRKYKENNPWIDSYRCAKQRCSNPNSKRWKDYGGRGIKFFLSIEEVKELWFRDKAYLMNKPSIDREDNDGDYVFDNCRFIELSENVIKDVSKKVIQLSKNNNIIKIYPSIISAQRALGLQNICNVLRGKQKTCGGFRWEYLKEV